MAPELAPTIRAMWKIGAGLRKAPGLGSGRGDDPAIPAALAAKTRPGGSGVASGGGRGAESPPAGYSPAAEERPTNRGEKDDA